jgi:hypothetical protein
MKIEFNNIKDGPAIAARRREYLAERDRQKVAQGVDNNTALMYVAGDPKFSATTMANEDIAAAEAALKGAEQRRDQLQAKIRELRAAGMSYDGAFRKALRDNPELVGYQSRMGATQGLRQFTFSDGQSLTASRTDYAQAAGFRTNAGPMPKTNLASQPVANWDHRPGVETRVAA